ncbi:DNA-binding LacI/PurR family transcriptional regulator [Martelella radicis]|uniref:DNA-binding LacI/PurR family transcriptional regulator n=2 Tax=Martelella radicis TaxID=1397476 RepID=A0A7W6PDQ0_9HYPH|nr:DNA-binding LacI/PurR family transcriptional regulator [Martelella radicis]
MMMTSPGSLPTRYASTPLTTIAYDSERLAYEAVDRLISIIKAGELVPPPRHETIERNVLIRRSTGSPRSRTSTSR